MSSRFRNFKVYNDSKELVKVITLICSKFPNGHFYLTDQIKRAALSVVLNIAEGSAKNSDKDFRRYVGNALGSINEVVACADVAHDLRLIPSETYAEIESKATSILNQLGGLHKKLS